MDLQPGQVLLNRYEFVRVLGQGAMGEVLEVRDRYSGISYALKRIPPEKAFGVAQMESVRANFALVSRLSHPHIATTRHLEFDPQSGHLLVLMDLVHGITLAEWIAKERHSRGGPTAPLPLELALSVTGQIAEALDYAHELPVSVDSQGRPKGILHRDLKPANVMIEERPGSSTGSHTVRLVDFGLAAEIQTTLTGMSIDPNRRDARNRLAGTLLYMAPEQYTAWTNGRWR
jgi:serine/threonine-protein kinase